MPFGFLKSLNCASSRSSEINKRTRKSQRRVKQKNTDTQNQPDVTQAVPNFSSFNPDSKQLERKFSIISGNEDISFWDIGNYKYTLTRCDNGHTLGAELAEMLSDRAKLEEEYAKSLKNWSKKWNNHLNKESTECEATKTGWKALLDIAEKSADVHLDMCKTLINRPVLKIKDWLKIRYEKSIINYKQTKEFENEFETAEKSWLVLNEKLRKYKKEYFDSIKDTKQSEETAKMAQSNPKYTLEQRSKLEEKVKRCKEEQERALKLYKDTLIELDLYKPRHIAKMTEVFEKTQNFEQERILFFKRTFSECQEILQNHHVNERFDEIFEEALQNINSVNPEDDLNWWSKHFGVETKPNWPVFEEYNQ
ncbi:unnamed protein product [Brachionus calyciflorus]|uniref:F-BAR domain-containing protein n=1 Tax=Brachionus calyciflorus TaxID=104777 RepID=A0A813W5A4_9BILA|nr:unnamed protein product [Brachionus calyciflorus]